MGEGFQGHTATPEAWGGGAARGEPWPFYELFEWREKGGWRVLGRERGCV